MKATRRMAAALTGVTIADAWPTQSRLQNLLRRSLPPPYLIRATLETVFGYRLPRRHDKSAWAAPLSYKDKTFEITDWKRSSWTIYGLDAADKEAEELGKKLGAAAKILDTYLREACRERLERGEFALDNQFHRYRHLYEMFRRECAVRSQPEPRIAQGDALKSAGFVRLDDVMNEMIQRSSKLQANLLAAVIFFFSLTEVIFDAVFALGSRHGLSYREFRKLDWAERFKALVGLSDKETERLYVRLLEIRRRYRNTPLHADPVFLFHLRGIGLIPASFETIDDPNVKPLFLWGDEEAASVIEVLAAALGLLEHHPRTQFGFAYAESGLVIHLDETALMRLRRSMESIEAFRDYLEDRIDFAEAAANMEI